jgi:uncharacterized protein YwgA
VSIKVAIVAALDAEPKRVMRGRTLLQKKLYFVSALSREDFGYEPHYYGPYSTVVELLSNLVEIPFQRVG